jgi:hypothetical protein
VTRPGPAAARKAEKDPRTSISTASLPGQEDAGNPQAVPTVPLRPDGWPDLLRRRPLSSGERERLREALAGELPEEAPAGPALVTCYLIIDGLDPADLGRLIRLRGRVHAAARTAAEGRQTTYDATATTISIGIRGPDAAERVSRLRGALAQLITRNGWTAREQPGPP